MDRADDRGRLEAKRQALRRVAARSLRRATARSLGAATTSIAPTRTPRRVCFIR